MRPRTELVLIYHITYKRSNKTILTLKFLDVGDGAVSEECEHVCEGCVFALAAAEVSSV